MIASYTLLIVAAIKLCVAEDLASRPLILDDGNNKIKYEGDISYKFSAFAAFNMEIEKELNLPKAPKKKNPGMQKVAYQFNSAFFTDTPSATPTSVASLHGASSFKFNSAFFDSPTARPTSVASLHEATSFKFNSAFFASETPSEMTTAMPSLIPGLSQSPTISPSLISQSPTALPSIFTATSNSSLPVCYLGAYCTSAFDSCIKGTTCSTIGSPSVCLLDPTTDLTSSCTANHKDCSAQSTCCSNAFTCTAMGSSSICTRKVPPLCSLPQASGTIGIAGQLN